MADGEVSMEYTQIDGKVLLRLDRGEEIVHSLTQICKTLDIQAGVITGIGATDKATVGLLDTKTKQYRSKEFVGDHEIASLIGNISTLQGETYLHLHVNLCNDKHISIGGHLSSAMVSVTFEGVIEVFAAEMKRLYDGSTGINMLHFK